MSTRGRETRQTCSAGACGALRGEVREALQSAVAQQGFLLVSHHSFSLLETQILLNLIFKEETISSIN